MAILEGNCHFRIATFAVTFVFVCFFTTCLEFEVVLLSSVLVASAVQMDAKRPEASDSTQFTL